MKHEQAGDIDEVLGWFDCRDKAEDFLVRYRTSSLGYEIVEFPINPKYIVNKLADPYLISLYKVNEEPFDVLKFDYIEQAEAAEREEYRFNFNPKQDLDTIEVMLFASTEEEAVAKAMKKRDEIIASGEWEKERNEALKSIL